MAPLCFTPEAFSRYTEAAAESVRLQESVPDYCFDCTAHHQAKMIAEEKCLYPGTVFVEIMEDDHPFINRVAPPEKFTVGVRVE